MDYEKQIEIIVDYLDKKAKDRSKYRVGVEFEHFIVNKDDFRSVTYYDENGTEDTLKKLEERGWTGNYEFGHILGAEKGNKVVTLEPGSQFEFSVVAQKEIKELELEYKEFLDEIIDILDEKNQNLLSIGYHPRTKIDEIKLLPKKRYDYMFEYFKTKGSHAHNMMKGTSALQVSLDYSNEEDYTKKMRVANGLSPILYGLCDNSYWFEGEKPQHYGLRTKIWTNMDDPRSGVAKGALEDGFGYRDYAKYILNVEPIFTMRDGEAINTGNKRIRDLVDPDNYNIKELEHLMTMVFPDVRTKGFVEIRMMDSLPYPLNFSIIALIIGIFYNEESLDRVYDLIRSANIEDVNRAKEDIIKRGPAAEYLSKPIIDWGKELVEISRAGLNTRDQDYLLPLEELLNSGKTPRILIEEKADRPYEEALDHCIMKKIEVI